MQRTSSSALLPPPPAAGAVADLLSGYVLPAGLVVLLTGMVWSGERSIYHQLFYALIAAPALVLAATRRELLPALARSPVFVAFVAFASYFALSVAWTDAERSAGSLLKRPLYVLMLFVACIELGRLLPDRLALVVRAAACGAAASATILLVEHLRMQPFASARLVGHGALINPLLTSHVFGFFAALWIGHWISAPLRWTPLHLFAVALLGGLIVATGSRTPLVALAATVLWLAALVRGPRGLIACAALVAIAGSVALAWPDVIAQRGLSYRPQIWADALRQISEHPVVGHGFEHPLRIHVGDLGYALWDPHNMTLGVLYQGGAIGLVLWVALYGAAFVAAWRGRASRAVLVCSAPLVYGLVAGMTEGGSFLSRPNEHWFLIWIPLALVAAFTVRSESPPSQRDGRENR
ncbi:MAG: O-antigen ligase family protein [Aromatoleum sp.]|uniref:O-antigen ligase family protein n=1 Tax=Aromatoleum sp. TaxID=2307007 RepID=UPI0028949495|nr:O-antigen ligase family protein [Aromatoleum sp.]MDT3670431.1 O-antigen ligase family protein [Aromatoleum sp.]